MVIKTVRHKKARERGQGVPRKGTESRTRTHPPMSITNNADSSTASRPKTGQYKGHAMIILNPEDRFPFQFGINKARLILQHIEEIRKFVEHAEHTDGGAPDVD